MAKADFHIPPPRENPELFGHEEAERSFAQDFAAGRLHHAYLMTGMKGIGKATLAYRLARYVLSQGALKAKASVEGPGLFGELLPPEPAPTGAADGMRMPADSPLFRRVAAGSHADLLALHPAYDSKKHIEKSIITVDEARKVPEFLSLTPAEGDWRVVVVDAVDQLNPNAANALLKILEEPPANALLLLVCHQPGGILPTIKSRCRQFALQPPTRDGFDRTLQAIAPSIDLADYPALHALSFGSPGLAITLTRHGGVGLYRGWLAAMQPQAGAEAVQKFIAEVGGSKSPDAWAMALHCWDVLMHRLCLHPLEVPGIIAPREPELLRAIAEAVPFAVRTRWLASARQLLAVGDAFNLDKKNTVRLMLDPARLSAQFPAAA